MRQNVAIYYGTFSRFRRLGRPNCRYRQKPPFSPPSYSKGFPLKDILFGPGFHDLGALLLRLVLGSFFFLARFRWVYDPSRFPSWFNPDRHKHLSERLCTCGYGTHPLLSGGVALIEITAGLGIVLGLLTIPAALALLGILVFATWCTARQKVMEQSPVDPMDCASCYLWRVEGVYILIALAIVSMGPGVYSLDRLIWTWM